MPHCVPISSLGFEEYYQYLTRYFEIDIEKYPIISSAHGVNLDRRILDTNLYVDDKTDIH